MEQAALQRWCKRLARAFHAVEEHQKRLTRLARRLELHQAGVEGNGR